jgi:ribosomal protein S21
MKEIKVSAGDHITRACARLVKEAPAFMVFNDVRVEAKIGDTAGDLESAFQSGMKRAGIESERKQREYDQTPEGKAKLSAAAAHDADEKRIRDETLQWIEAAGVRSKYPWDGMREISGFGGGYEEACRNMVYAGLVWIDKHPNADLATWETVDAKALEKAVLAACPDCSGAMHGATMTACAFIAKQGWPKFVEAMTETP